MTPPCPSATDGRLLIHVSELSGRFGHVPGHQKARKSMRLNHASIFAVLLAAMLTAAPHRATARDHDGSRHDQARRAVETGEIRPLEDILTIVRGKLPGDIAGVEIEHRDGRWLYEFRVVDGEGRLFEVYVDARTGEVERIKEK
jgi:uncharacterized membrane protein YkoI